MTPEELERIRKYEAWLAEQENKDKTTRVNPFDTGEGAERTQNRQDRQIGRMDWESLMRFMEQNQEDQFNRVKDAGGFGGIRESDRNPGGRKNAGIDWLKDKYDPANNPAEGRNVQGDAAMAVANAKLEQGRRRQEEAMQLAREGTLSRDIGGATLTDFYGANRGDAAAAHAFGAGASPAQGGGPDFSVLNIPDQYGGGFGYASQKVPLPQADPSLLLPTGGYNAAMGVGGSGVPMSAGEAASVGNLGNGIYAPRDASDPSSQDAIMARRVLAQAGINQRMKEFYENPFAQAPAAPVAQAQAPVGTAPSPVNVPVAPPPPPPAQGPVSYGEFTGGNFFGPPLVSPSEGPATNLLASMADQLLGGAAGLNDAVNYYIANPLMWAFTGNPEYYKPNATKAAAAQIFR